MKANIFDSMKSAAAALGLKMRVLKRAKAAGCQAFRGSRVYGDELQAWVRANPTVVAEAGADAPDEGDVKRRIDLAKAKWQEMKNEMLAKRLVEKAWVAECMRKAAGRLSTYRARSEAEHPTRIPDGDIAAKRRVLGEIWDEVYAAMGELQTCFDERAIKKAKRK
jgi:hypothetical protein